MHSIEQKAIIQVAATMNGRFFRTKCNFDVDPLHLPIELNRSRTSISSQIGNKLLDHIFAILKKSQPTKKPYINQHHSLQWKCLVVIAMLSTDPRKHSCGWPTPR